MPIIQTERYELDARPIGRGGFGEIYLAKDLLFDRKVVIKTILQSQLYGIDEPDIRRQFFRESVICAKLSLETPHIVKVLDYGYDRESDMPFFVMEYIEGHDLSQDVGRFSWDSAVKLLDHMFKALVVAHQKGVVHSDISPDNIMFDDITGNFKLNDFGLAKLLNSTLMRRGSMLSLTGGKPGYLPLLDWQTGSRSAHSDLYGLTATVIQLLTGRLPIWEFKQGVYSPPPASQYFDAQTLSDADKVFLTRFSNNKDDCTMFSVGSPFTTWFYTGESNAFGIELTKGDLITLFERVLVGDIVAVEDAMEFIRNRVLDRMLPREAEFREDVEQRNLELTAKGENAKEAKP